MSFKKFPLPRGAPAKDISDNKSEAAPAADQPAEKPDKALIGLMPARKS